MISAIYRSFEGETVLSALMIKLEIVNNHINSELESKSSLEEEIKRVEKELNKLDNLNRELTKYESDFKAILGSDSIAYSSIDQTRIFNTEGRKFDLNDKISKIKQRLSYKIELLEADYEFRNELEREIGILSLPENKHLAQIIITTYEDKSND